MWSMLADTAATAPPPLARGVMQGMLVATTVALLAIEVVKYEHASVTRAEQEVSVRV